MEKVPDIIPDVYGKDKGREGEDQDAGVGYFPPDEDTPCEHSAVRGTSGGENV